MTSQRWDPEGYDRNARFVSDLGVPVVALLAPRAGERVLDVGCGDGVLTARLVELGCKVVGVDGSPEQVAAARERGIDARVESGEELDFDAAFDAVFSNAALHWMKRADAVIDGVWRALVPGGRFVGEMGGHRCVERIRTALIAALERRGVDGRAADPWYFPTVADYRGRLERRGFEVRSIELFDRPTPLPGDVVGWLETFGEWATAKLPEGERPKFLAEVRDALQPVLSDAEGRWTADYTRLRFAAVKPATARAAG
ncbi:MAG TPA: methyltransferase domain-containing protein [Candidatus Binatia bacterium]|nr:methyltransferase domain-containing protein [Candidatus Binatia bacterium]